MTPDQGAAVLQATLMTAATTVLVAKVCLECWADRLRSRLAELETELFNLAGRGRIGFDDPDYVMLRDSIRNVAALTHRVGSTRLVAMAVSGRLRDRIAPPENDGRECAARLGGTLNSSAHPDLASLRVRALLATGGGRISARTTATAIESRDVAIDLAPAAHHESARGRCRGPPSHAASTGLAARLTRFPLQTRRKANPLQRQPTATWS